ncbi:MAG: NrtA/SsuA/CpmA family ABC transporter substrate-binding protein [Syntrophales bacterium]|nr:NrtA/SsuA/CpmA family ABC transporter substrate-binding protein [Syntrophales bacterium]
MTGKKIIIAIGIILIFAIAGLVELYVYNSERKQVKIAGSVNLGFVGGESASALYIADELGIFTGSGINVVLHPFEAGLDSYNAMLKGEVDVSGPTEYVIAGGVFRRERIRVISTIVKVDVISIMGRKDHGIDNPSDLAGKRIGLARNTILEFYLGRFLDLHGMNIRDVTPVDMNYPVGVKSIKEGAVDAVLSLPPFYDSIKGFLGARVIDWSAQSGQSIFGVLTSTDDWITRNPDLVARLLMAIDQANLYIVQHPKEAKAIVQKRLNLDAASIDRAWQRNHYSLSLDHALLIAMEDEARWMIKNHLTREKTVPDFMKYIYLDGLKAVKPEAVNIIH